MNFNSKKTIKRCFVEDGKLKCNQHTITRFSDGRVEESDTETNEENLDQDIGENFENFGLFANHKDFFNVDSLFKGK